MNRQKLIRQWEKTVKLHKRQTFLWKIWDKLGWRFQYLGWKQPAQPPLIPMKPIGDEIETVDAEYWSGYYSPEEFVDKVLPNFRTQDSNCRCIRCLRERGSMINGFPEETKYMIVCPQCGNKRCPHASDHRHACTNSNEPGQIGSVYGPNELPPPLKNTVFEEEWVGKPVRDCSGDIVGFVTSSKLKDDGSLRMEYELLTDSVTGLTCISNQLHKDS